MVGNVATGEIVGGGGTAGGAGEGGVRAAVQPGATASDLTEDSPKNILHVYQRRKAEIRRERSKQSSNARG